LDLFQPRLRDLPGKVKPPPGHRCRCGAFRHFHLLPPATLAADIRAHLLRHCTITAHNIPWQSCQEQIELSAFSVLPEGQFSEQEVSGGHALSSIIFLGKELSTAILPRPLRSMAGERSSAGDGQWRLPDTSDPVLKTWQPLTIPT
jgi:hypothetical protein